jgi:hypothetical protein
MAQIKGKQIKDNSLDPKKLKTGLIPSSVKLGSEITDFSGEADSTLVTKKFVVDADTAETTAREAADTALQGNIDTLTTTVGDNKTAIDTALAAETTARTNADTTLQGNIDTLTTTVGDNKTAIDTALAAETTARTNADTTLQGNIDTLTTTVGDNKTAIDTALAAETTARTDADTANLTAAKDYTDSEITANVTDKKGVANGLAPLGADAKIAETYLPDSIVGQVEYKGTYDISGGVEPEAAAAANKGHYYIISVAGSRTGFVGNDGDDTEFAIGDWIISDGTKWSKVSNSDAVTTVHGRNGAIVSVAGDYTANQVDFTPANGLASSDVQAAIEEVKDLVDALDTASTSALSSADGEGLLWNGTSEKFDVQTGNGIKIDADKVTLDIEAYSTTSVVSIASDLSITNVVSAVTGEIVHVDISDNHVETSASNTNDSLLGTSYVGFDKIDFVHDTPTGSERITLQNGVEITTTGTNGVKITGKDAAYAADYSATYTDRSLVDKAFVLDQVATTSSASIVAGDGLAETTDANGVKTLAINVDESSLEIVGDTLNVKAAGITNAMLAGSIEDSNLSTIATAGKVSNSATTATAAATADAIITRDASGDFAANTATLTAVTSSGLVESASEVKAPMLTITGTPTNDTDATTKLYVDTAISTLTTDALKEEVHIEVTGGVATAGITAYTGAITFTVGAQTDATLYVNGIKIQMTETAFFAPASWTTGNTRFMAPVSADDKLFFDITALGYAIDADDIIEIVYYI